MPHPLTQISYPYYYLHRNVVPNLALVLNDPKQQTILLPVSDFLKTMDFIFQFPYVILHLLQNRDFGPILIPDSLSVL